MEKKEKKEFYNFGVKMAQGYALLGLIPCMAGSEQELALRADVQKEIRRVFPEFGKVGSPIDEKALRAIKMTPRQVRAMAWGFLTLITNLEAKKVEIDQKRIWFPGVDHFGAIEALCVQLDLWKHVKPLIHVDSYPEPEWEMEDTFKEPPPEAKAEEKVEATPEPVPAAPTEPAGETPKAG